MSEPAGTREPESVGGVRRLVLGVYAAAAIALMSLWPLKLASNDLKIMLSMSEGTALGLLTLFSALILALFVAVRTLVDERGKLNTDDHHLAVMTLMLFGLAMASATAGLAQLMHQAPETIRLSSVLVGGASVAVVAIAMMGARVVPGSVSRGYDERVRLGREERIGRSKRHLEATSGSRGSAWMWALAATLVPLALAGGALVLARVTVSTGTALMLVGVITAAAGIGLIAIPAAIAGHWELLAFALLVSFSAALCWLAALVRVGSVADRTDTRSVVVLVLLIAAVPCGWALVALGHRPGGGLRYSTRAVVVGLTRTRAPQRAWLDLGRCLGPWRKITREVRAMFGLQDRDSDESS